MALSNWLTRNEWNAAYFASIYCRYVLALQNSELPPDLSTSLRTGICILDKFGYNLWTGVSVPNNEDPNSVHKEENSLYGVNACVSEGDNSSCLVEVMMGTLQYKDRLKENIKWIKSLTCLNEEFKCSFIQFCEMFLKQIEDNAINLK